MAEKPRWKDIGAVWLKKDNMLGINVDLGVLGTLHATDFSVEEKSLMKKIEKKLSSLKPKSETFNWFDRRKLLPELSSNYVPPSESFD